MSTEETSTRRRSAYRRLPVDRRREEVLEAALQLYSRSNPGDVSIDDVAAAAGTSRASVYRYFANKQDLYLAALRSAADELANRIEQQMKGSASEQLRSGLAAYFDFLDEHEAWYVALMGQGPTGGSAETMEIIDGVRQAVYRLIERVLDTPAHTVTLDLTVRSWVGGVELAGLRWLQRREPARSELETLLADQLIMTLIAASLHDPALVEPMHRMLREEPSDGPTADLFSRLRKQLTPKTLALVGRLTLRR